MYSACERENILNFMNKFFEETEAIRGAILLGSGTVGFTDAFSDLDFMLAVKTDEDCILVRDMLLNKLNEFGYSFGKVVEFKKNRFLIVAILDNFLELDLSIVLIDELIAMSEHWKVLLDKDEQVYQKMSDDWNWWSHIQQNKSILDHIHEKNLIVEISYLFRRALIELARDNLIYAADLISEIRKHILYIECLLEGKKTHQIKNYSSLSPDFINQISNTYVSINKRAILDVLIYIKNLFFNLIEKITNCEDDIKYNGILEKYINELFPII